jgi:hypothetical protein
MEFSDSQPLANDASGIAANTSRDSSDPEGSSQNIPLNAVPDQIGMTISSEIPIEDEYWNDLDEEDDCLLYCFTVSTGACASAYNRCRNRWLQCGEYLRERRFWICKMIIMMMDMAILRGAFAMGSEYCSQEQEVSEFGWVLWSSFLVFCKFVYLRPVFHLHQACSICKCQAAFITCVDFIIFSQKIGVFHRTAADACKSFLIETVCLICHCSMFAFFIYRSFVPGKCHSALDLAPSSPHSATRISFGLFVDPASRAQHS